MFLALYVFGKNLKFQRHALLAKYLLKKLRCTFLFLAFSTSKLLLNSYPFLLGSRNTVIIGTRNSFAFVVAHLSIGHSLKLAIHQNRLRYNNASIIIGHSSPLLEGATI